MKENMYNVCTNRHHSHQKHIYNLIEECEYIIKVKNSHIYINNFYDYCRINVSFFIVLYILTI